MRPAKREAGRRGAQDPRCVQALSVESRPIRAASRDAAIIPQPTASPCRYFAIARSRLEGVREGMAEIEDFAQPGLAFVVADDLGL